MFTLCSPAYATPLLLDRSGLTAKDIDVFEYHEAFAVSKACCFYVDATQAGPCRDRSWQTFKQWTLIGLHKST